MNGDLVDTLRKWHALKGWPHLRDAADEIERLRAENAKLRAAASDSRFEASVNEALNMGDGSYRP